MKLFYCYYCKKWSPTNGELRCKKCGKLDLPYEVESEDKKYYYLRKEINGITWFNRAEKVDLI